MKTVYAAAILAFLGSVGCGVEADPWCKMHRCEVAGERTYAPSKDIEALTAVATQRWGRATGLDLRVAKDGIPVKFVDQVFSMKSKDELELDKDGNPIELCGATYHETPKDKTGFRILRIDIAENPTVPCPTHIEVLLHELGHSLRPGAEHPYRGLMSEYDPAKGNIDEFAVEWVCEGAPCSTFEPEWYLDSESVQVSAI